MLQKHWCANPSMKKIHRIYQHKDIHINAKTEMIGPYKYIICTCIFTFFNQGNNKEVQRCSVQTQGHQDNDRGLPRTIVVSSPRT